MTTESKNTKELAETLTQFEVNNGVITADKVSTTDRFKQRLDRFGKMAPEAKKISRALRFGTTHEAIDSTARKRRLERFGAIPHSTEDEQQRKRQRIDRFGGVVTSSPVLSDAIKKRAERFGNISQIAKTNKLNEQKIKRAERFKLILNS